MAAGSAGEARDKALENTDRALEFLFENRRRRFMSVKELEELVLEK
jgi:predicted RNase H-like HicB family nuclease